MVLHTPLSHYFKQILIQSFLFHVLEEYSEPRQTSPTNLFAKIVNDLLPYSSKIPENSSEFGYFLQRAYKSPAYRKAKKFLKPTIFG